MPEVTVSSPADPLVPELMVKPSAALIDYRRRTPVRPLIAPMSPLRCCWTG